MSNKKTYIGKKNMKKLYNNKKKLLTQILETEMKEKDQALKENEKVITFLVLLSSVQVILIIGLFLSHFFDISELFYSLWDMIGGLID